jgi:hypothetical protein
VTDPYHRYGSRGLRLASKKKITAANAAEHAKTSRHSKTNHKISRPENCHKTSKNRKTTPQGKNRCDTGSTSNVCLCVMECAPCRRLAPMSSSPTNLFLGRLDAFFFFSKLNAKSVYWCLKGNTSLLVAYLLSPVLCFFVVVRHSYHT